MRTVYLISSLARLNKLKESALIFAESLNDWPEVKNRYIEHILKEDKKCKKCIYTLLKWEN